MRSWRRSLAGIVIVASCSGFAPHASAESCSLEMKKVNTSSSSRSEYIFRATGSQHFSQAVGEGVRFAERADVGKFADVIKKEPKEYETEHPIRGVFKLGSQDFGFVLDSTAKVATAEEGDDEDEAEESGGFLSGLSKALFGDKEEARSRRPQVVPYDRLYFDRDHDGDLTDEEVVKAESTSEYEGGLYYFATFPRVDISIETDSETFDYAFTLRVTAQAVSNYGYVSGSLNAAAYREGEITLNGKKHRVVLVDFNSNGRFDDASEINTSVQVPDGRVYASYGDRLYIDPETNSGTLSPYDVTTGDYLHNVGNLVNLDGRFYEMTVSPAGDKLTLEPSDIGVGYLSNPTKDFRAVVYGDRGILKIRGDESGKAAVPAGSWKLMNYTLDRTGFDRKKSGDAEAERSILDVLTEALGPKMEARAPGSTVVSATATRDYEAVDVEEGETVALPFGPPYQPKVDVQYREGADQVSLGMSLVGSAGELCSTMMINGKQPGKPKITIKAPDGETVAEGQFEYG